MNRYVIRFAKNGYIKYTSHLDTLRMFQRAFKRAGIALRYSQGFNPHPKMSFAQPLSLGYSSCCELLEFETEMTLEGEMITERLQAALPEGLSLLGCRRFDEPVKSLAAVAEAARYTIQIPKEDCTEGILQKQISDYLKQSQIMVIKRKKKTREETSVDIRPQIRQLSAASERGKVFLDVLLDCGSTSNLSPELFLLSFLEFTGWPTERYQIEVERTEIIFSSNLQF